MQDILRDSKQMKYEDIPTFSQRLQGKSRVLLGQEGIQQILHEEVAALRNYIEWYIENKYAHNWVEGANNNTAA